jgi:hypothetical protein
MPAHILRTPEKNKKDEEENVMALLLAPQKPYLKKKKGTGTLNPKTLFPHEPDQHRQGGKSSVRR